MKDVLSGRARRVAIALLGVAVAAFAAEGVARATTSPSTVYTACELKGVGTIRIIDPTLPAKNTNSHCTSLETQITWNQVGPAGTNGTNGTNGSNGTNGTDGTSVTATPEPAGANCPNGGAQLTSVSGTSYVCNGAAGSPGTNGQDGVGVTTLPEPAGANCANGGVQLTSSTGVTYVCNGADGSSGSGSSDAATLSGHPLADFKDGCGSGFVAYGGQCWESIDVSGYNHGQAAGRCAGLGGRLPTVGELTAAVQAPGGTFAQSLLLDWASDADTSSSSYFVVSSSDANNFLGTRSNLVSSYVRCVVPKGNGL